MRGLKLGFREALLSRFNRSVFGNRYFGLCCNQGRSRRISRRFDGLPGRVFCGCHWLVYYVVLSLSAILSAVVRHCRHGLKFGLALGVNPEGMFMPDMLMKIGRTVLLA